MAEPNLFIICAAAFLAVIVLLSLLAGSIRILTALFPVPDDADAALIAAITSAHESAYPGTRITRIEEHR